MILIFKMLIIALGLVGPLLIEGNHVAGYIVCPFATTEGALIASASRGAALVTRSGGVRTTIIKQGMVRAPCFYLHSAKDAERLYQWVLDHYNNIAEQVKMYSQHANLMGIEARRLGRSIVVLFKYTTGEAAGQNMTTSSTSHACNWILKTLKEEMPNLFIKKFDICTNLEGDKKMAFRNLTNTRGIHAIAEAWIPESVISDTLKVNDSVTYYN